MQKCDLQRAVLLLHSSPSLCSRAVTAAKQLPCMLLGIRPSVPNHPSDCPGCFYPWGNDNERQELLTLMVARNFLASSREACVPAGRASSDCSHSVAWMHRLNGLLQTEELQKLYHWPKGACPLEEQIKNGN